MGHQGHVGFSGAAGCNAALSAADVSQVVDPAEEIANLEPGERRGWHSLRRKFATELKATPLKDLCRLAGWKRQRTVLACYQRPDEATTREAFSGRQRAREGKATALDRRKQSGP